MALVICHLFLHISSSSSLSTTSDLQNIQMNPAESSPRSLQADDLQKKTLLSPQNLHSHSLIPEEQHWDGFLLYPTLSIQSAK